MSDRVDTEAVRALADAATPGPWQAGEWPEWEPYHIVSHGVMEAWEDDDGRRGTSPTPIVDGSNYLTDADREFIAAARTLVPALCDELDRTRKALRIAAEQCVSTTDPDEVPWLIDRWMTRAALAESGDPERPEGNPEPPFMVDGYDMTPPHWHRATERPATMDTGLVEVRQVRCPTCGSDDPSGPCDDDEMPNRWHRATDTEGAGDA